MQVRQAVKALKGEDTAAHPPAANPAAVAATALLALSGGAMYQVRGVLSNITNIPAAAASIVAAAATATRGGMTDNLSPLTGLLSPLKKHVKQAISLRSIRPICGKIRTHTISPFLGLLNSCLLSPLKCNIFSERGSDSWTLHPNCHNSANSRHCWSN